MLRQKINPKTEQKEYCLVSTSNPKKILKWFGAKKPSDESVAKEEARVNFFKHQGK